MISLLLLITKHWEWELLRTEAVPIIQAHQAGQAVNSQLLSCGIKVARLLATASAMGMPDLLCRARESQCMLFLQVQII